MNGSTVARANAVAPDVIAADLRAAAVWVRRGWTTGVMCNPTTGAVCLVGGIAAGVYGALPVRDGVDPYFSSSLLTAGQRDRWEAAEDAVTRYLARNDYLDQLNVVAGEATDWNDLLCESGEQAAQILEATAADLEALTEPEAGGRPC